MSAHVTPSAEAEHFRQAANLLGGDRTLRHPLHTPLDVHDMLLRRLPVAALNHLVANLVRLKTPASLEAAVGMSLRTVQRRKDAPANVLSQAQSGRVWVFAAVLAKAIAVLGSQEDAEQWLERPASGLNQLRPIDLLATPAGVHIVEVFLERLEYGVYA